MVAKTPPKLHKRLAPPPLHPHLLHEAIRKVDMCMARLQELQFTASGGAKSINNGANLRPRSSTGCFGNKCNQDRSWLSKTAKLASPSVKSHKPTEHKTEEWRRMSLPAMLVNETMSEILNVSHIAKDMIAAINRAEKSSNSDEPITPVSNRRSNPQQAGSHSQLRSKRRAEKQSTQPNELRSPKLQRARSRIRFKTTTPIKRSPEKKRTQPNIAANRVSPRNKPWARKTVLFPNPLFLSSPSSKQQKFCRTRSPIIAARSKHQQPHRFVIKSPAMPSKIKTLRPLRPLIPPAQSVTRSSPKIARLRRSLSPARLVSRLASPLKGRFTPGISRAAVQNQINGNLQVRLPPRILKV